MWGPLDVLKETWEASEDRSEESGRESHRKDLSFVSGVEQVPTSCLTEMTLEELEWPHIMMTAPLTCCYGQGEKPMADEVTAQGPICGMWNRLVAFAEKGRSTRVSCKSTGRAYG